jgi:hypothetical protein
LWGSALGNIHARQDFQARYQSLLQRVRHHGELAQKTIYADAHQRAIVMWFDVNITGFLGYRGC